MDLRMEAAAANALNENFKNDERFVVPKVFWELTTKRMLVSSWIDGIKINDLDSLRSGNYSIETITKNSAEAFFLQVFRGPDCNMIWQSSSKFMFMQRLFNSS